MRLSRTACAILLLATLAACSPANDAPAIAAAQDAANEGDAGDAGPDVLTTPKISAKLTASPAVGNAPLDVTLTVAIDGVDKSQCYVTWDFGDALPVETYDLSKEDQRDKNVVHRQYQNKGSYTVKATVQWKPAPKKANAEALTTITVASPASLQFSSDPAVKLESPETVGAGDDVTLTFSVLNAGDDVDTPFEIAIYMSATDTVDETALLIGKVGLPSLGAAKTADFLYDPDPKKSKALIAKVPAGLADGAYFLLAQIDPTKSVNEIDRLDNLAIAGTQLTIDTKVTAKADLTITAPTFDDNKEYSPGDAVNFNYTVANQGLGEAKGVKFGVFLSTDTKLDYDFDPKKPSDSPQVDKMLTSLANSTFQHIQPNSSLPLVYSVVVPDVPNGEYFLIARVDVLDAIVETDESNNTAVTPKQLKVLKIFKTGIDLALVDMTVKPKGVALKDSINVLYTVKNTGTAPTPPFPAGIYFCPNKAFSKANCFINQTNFTIAPLAPGETKSDFKAVSIDAETPVQNWFIYMQLDPDSKIVELDESNNVKTFDELNGGPLKVEQTSNVDLWPDNIGFHPEIVQAGTAIKVGYTVHNDGTTGAPGATTWYALSPTGACSTGAVLSGQAVLIKKVAFNGLNPFEQVEVSDLVPIPLGLDHTLSQYQLCVILDGEKAIAKEKNSGNNAAVSVGKLTVTGAKGGCFEDATDLQGANNDTSAKAVILPPESTQSVGSCGNEDWWKISVPQGNSLVVTMTSTPDLWTSDVPGDLDIDLLAPDGKTLLDTVKQPGSVKKAAALTVTATGDYLVRIYAHVPGAQAQYKLAVQVIGPAQGPDLFAGGLTVSPQSTYPGALIKTKLKLSNLGNQATGVFTVRYVLSPDTVIDAKDQVLKDVVYGKGIAASASQVVDQTLVLPVVAGGKWFVGVLADSTAAINEADEGNNAVVSNTLQLSSQLSCASDSYSGNHTLDDAAALPATTATYAKLNVCPGLEDWFAIQLPAGKAFSVKLGWKYLSGKGLVGVQIVDPSKTAVVAGVASPVNSVATIPYLQTGGTYYIHTYVLPENGTPVPYDYDLTVTVAEPDPSDVCLADYYEANNSAKSGPELGCGEATLSLCLGDEDWFHLTMQKDEVVTLDLQNAAQAFQLKIYDNPNLPAIKIQASNGPLKFTAPASGTFYMQIAYKNPGTKPASFAYGLKVDGGKGVDLLAKLQSVFPAQIVQGEDVYVTAQISNVCQDPASAFSYAYYFSADAKLDKDDVLLATKGLPGLLGKANASFDDKAIIPIEAKPGPAYLILAADSSNTVAESQELNNSDASAIEVVKLCLADVLEPNGAPQIAAPLQFGTTPDLSLCPYDLDWYTFDAVKGQTVTLTMTLDQSKGDLDLRLYKVAKFGQPVATSATKKSPEQIVWTADETTKYYVRINGFAGDSNAYSLAYCNKVGGSCVECKDDSVCSALQQCDLVTTLCGPKKCTAQDVSLCNDGNACTADLCGANQTCSNVAAIQPCDDGDVCSLGETCDGKGTCIAPSQQTLQALASGVTATDVGNDVTLTADGGYVLAGARDVGQGLQGYLERRDAQGKVLWSKVYPEAPVPSTLQAAVVIAGDEIVAAGSAAISGKAGVTAGWLLHVDLKTGATIASSTLPVGAQSARFEDLTAVAGGSFVIAVGQAGNPGKFGEGQDAWAALLDLDGNALWTQYLGGVGDDAFHAVQALADGSVLAVGDDDVGGMRQGLATRLAGDTGNVLWSKTVTTVGAQTTLRAVTLASQATAVMAGGCDEGQTGVKPPAWQGAVVRIGLDGKIGTQTIVPATTPQAPAFVGQKTARFDAVIVRKDGSLALAGTTGATGEKTWAMDAAIWQLGVDDSVKSVAAYGKGGTDGFAALVAWGNRLLAHGTLAIGEVTADAVTLQLTPPALDCDDTNACTADTCNAILGCSHAAVADLTPCGTGKACLAGVCQ